jgi:hypothetical protein
MEICSAPTNGKKKPPGREGGFTKCHIWPDAWKATFASFFCIIFKGANSRGISGILSGYLDKPRRRHYLIFRKISMSYPNGGV